MIYEIDYSRIRPLPRGYKRYCIVCERCHKDISFLSAPSEQHARKRFERRGWLTSFDAAFRGHDLCPACRARYESSLSARLHVLIQNIKNNFKRIQK